MIVIVVPASLCTALLSLGCPYIPYMNNSIRCHSKLPTRHLHISRQELSCPLLCRRNCNLRYSTSSTIEHLAVCRHRPYYQQHDDADQQHRSRIHVHCGCWCGHLDCLGVDNNLPWLSRWRQRRPGRPRTKPGCLYAGSADAESQQIASTYRYANLQ